MTIERASVEAQLKGHETELEALEKEYQSLCRRREVILQEQVQCKSILAWLDSQQPIKSNSKP